MDDLKFLLERDFKVVGFYPYTSIVSNRIIGQSHNHEVKMHHELNTFGSKVKTSAIDLGCVWDNKVVVEIELLSNLIGNETKSNLFVGFKDNLISIGLSVFQPDDFTKKYNLKF